MAIALSSSSSANTAAVNLTVTIASFTVSAGDTLLVVVVPFYSTPSKQVTSVSWNGSTVGWTRAIRQNDGTRNATIEIWTLSSPTATTGSVVVTTDGNDTVNIWGAAVYSLSGTKTSSVVYGAVGSIALTGSTSISDSVTVATTGDWLIDGAILGTVTSVAGGGSQTSITINSSTISNMASYKSGVTAGASAMSWTFGASSVANAHAVIGIAQAISGGKLSSKCDLDGLGGIGQQRFNRL